MGTNYVKYKARILQMLSSNGGHTEIWFSVDMPSLSTIGVKSVTIGGTPMKVVFGGESQIDTIIDLLQIAKMAVEIPIQSAIDVLSIALAAQHIKSEIALGFGVSVSSVTPTSQYVEVETISNALDVLVGMRTPASINTEVNTMPTISDLEAQLRLCGYNELSVTIDDGTEMTFALHADTPKDIIGSSEGQSQLSGTLNLNDALELSMGATGTLEVSASIETDTDWIQIKSNTACYLLSSSDMAVDSSKVIASNEESFSAVTVVFGLITGAILSDYDADTLSEMDTYTLDELKYKIQHN